MNYFKNKKTPTMSELVNWFQIEFTELANDMKACNHAAVDNQPNPYHIEDSVWTHTMMVCLQAQNDNANKINLLSALLHDTGKPQAREVMPFDKPKPTYTESNEIREADTESSKTEGLKRETKTAMRGHEGISVYKSVKPLEMLVEMGVIFPGEMTDILTIISLHGTLFDSIKEGKEYKPKKVAERWKNNKDLFPLFLAQVRYDSTGRFSPSMDTRADAGSLLGTELYGKDFMDEFWPDRNFDEGTKIIKSKNITCLVGVPLSGKSTYIDASIDDKMDDCTTVVSRDATLLELGRFKYGKSLDYGEIWSKLTNDDQKEIDKMIRSLFECAVLRGDNIFIDMTNTGPKPRKKWFNFQIENVSKDERRVFNEKLKAYGCRTVFFATDYDTIFERNIARFHSEGKFIPESVIHNMMKGLILPMGNEAENTKTVINVFYDTRG